MSISVVTQLAKITYLHAGIGEIQLIFTAQGPYYVQVNGDPARFILDTRSDNEVTIEIDTTGARHTIPMVLLENLELCVEGTRALMKPTSTKQKRRRKKPKSNTPTYTAGEKLSAGQPVFVGVDGKVYQAVAAPH